MCVIFIASKDNPRPTEDMVKNAWTTNDAGGGVAWREGAFVKWKKGIMNLDEMQTIIKSLPLPFIAHFRIPSQGGKLDKLCHPFPIDKQVPLALSGRTKGSVLFHNGHWTKWKDSVLESVISSGTPVPSGKWSDTRGMAFVASIYGPGILEFIDEKAVVFGPEQCEVFGSGWKIVNKIYCSNDFFDKPVYSGGYSGNVNDQCKESKCNKWALRNSRFCYEHKHLENLDFGDEDNELPQKKGETTVLGPEKKDGLNNERGGGDHKLLPFYQIDALYKSQALDEQGKKLISKNFWKKARKYYQKNERKLLKHAKRLAVEKLNEEMLTAQSLMVH